MLRGKRSLVTFTENSVLKSAVMAQRIMYFYGIIARSATDVRCAYVVSLTAHLNADKITSTPTNYMGFAL